MSKVLDEAFDPSRRNKIHLSRLQNKPVAVFRIGCQNKGYCETCMSYKPAPKNRKKGWKCDECTEASKSKPAD